MITLPRKAAKKLTLLRIETEDAGALVNSTMQRISSVKRAISSNPPDLADLEHELARLQGNAADHQTKHNAMVQLLTQITTGWLPTLKPDSVLVDIEQPAEFVPRKDEPVAAAILRLRNEIASLDDELRRANRAVPTRACRREAAKRYVDDLVLRSPPKVASSKYGKFSVDFTDAGSFTVKANVAAALAFLEPEKFLKRLYALIDDAPEPELALTATDKAARVAAIRSEMLKLEVLEEAAIEFAAYEQIQITRRPFANPLAVLSCTLRSKQATAA
ncbi:hypothetical protein HNQ36_003310 [Afipia massiliensis]|uniref:Uncharacterized protein n=1 Tax=Afipia massiliensis TaxID=211460 RepID=A0A840MYG3_9BRAD|nr:hypothetical protein [Afipia massiliensis]MBB5053319.1 hypothetical protein [Afipia massiliensis]